jgi:hypothetical protein
MRRHPTPAIHKPTPSNSAPQQSSLLQPNPFAQAAHVSPSVLPPSHASSPSMLQIAMGHSGPQQPYSADPTNLLHVSNSASLLQQNAAAQTLARLIETVIAVAQGQGMNTAIIQNYLSALPMPPSLVQPSPLSAASQSSHVPDFTSQPLEEPPGSSVPDSSLEGMDQSSNSTRAPRPLSLEPSLAAKRRRTSPKPPSQAKKIASNPRQNPHESPQLARSVFSTKNGHPILVFIQIDTRGRHGIVHLIKVGLPSLVLTA